MIYRVLAKDIDGHRTYVYVEATSRVEALDTVPRSITAHSDE